MVLYYPTIEIPVLCFGIILWIFCCRLAKKRREAEGWPSRPDNPPSVYIIPLYEGGPEDDEEEEIMDLYEAYFQSSNGALPQYSTRESSPPPPYTLEPPSYSSPPPSYSDPPGYSEQR